ncbi:GntR family transcriptional regulator [Dorea sp. D27]|uniref:GntR family transcriptional regulator n=1 Tax=Dorea sp. D27 TaxID=658665 RepID=UPI00067395C2|nr:GntR family transcriptional regulator [Dorea sp. D27]KMZ52719.1 transcriptional regulator, GntR family [Dorea sp. D27]
MENESSLQFVIYDILKTQIEFGTYRCGDRLPKIEDTCSLLMVSLDTARSAYRRLQKEGYVTLSKNKGSIVKADYQERAVEQHIQTFFAKRKDAFLDLLPSMPILFGNIQLAAWKKVTQDKIDRLEELIAARQVHPSYLIMQYLNLIYGSLDNPLLMRLIHKICIHYMIPFFSLKDYRSYIDAETDAVSFRAELCRRKDWAALYTASMDFIDTYATAVQHFYESRITGTLPSQQAAFTWSSYKKASQICYSLALELMTTMGRGGYTAGDYLPSISRLAEEKQVSVSTVRRTLALLNSIGMTRSVNGIGTQILRVDQIEAYCGWTEPQVRQRLSDFAYSLQIILLSCRDAAAAAFSSTDGEGIRSFINQLDMFKNIGRPDLVTSYSLKFIAQAAPYKTIRTVYRELFQQLLWGYPMRCKLGNQDAINSYYLPYLDDMAVCLENFDAEGYAIILEELLQHQAEVISDAFMELEFAEACTPLT